MWLPCDKQSEPTSTIRRLILVLVWPILKIIGKNIFYNRIFLKNFLHLSQNLFCIYSFENKKENIFDILGMFYVSQRFAILLVPMAGDVWPQMNVSAPNFIQETIANILCVFLFVKTEGLALDETSASARKDG